MCAPPLLLIVTPGAAWVLEDVAPDVFVLSVAVVPVPVVVDPLVEVETPPVVVAEDEVEVPGVEVAAADPVDDSPVEAEVDVEFGELVVPVVSAAAQP